MKDFIVATFVMGIAFSALLYRSHNIGFRESRTKSLSKYQTKELNIALLQVSGRLKGR